MQYLDQSPRDRNQQFTTALNALNARVAVVDPSGIITAVNETWVNCGLNFTDPDLPSLLPGDPYTHALRGITREDRHAATTGVDLVLAGTHPAFTIEYRSDASGSDERWHELRACALPEGSGGGAVLLCSLITERRLRDERIRFMAEHDELTGLASRHFLMECMRREQLQGQLGLILLDLDGFKFVNDTYGHAAGDTVLRTVADALSAATPAGTIVGRHGGDEFCVALPDCSATRLVRAQAKITGELRRRMSQLPPGLRVSASTGGTMVSADEPLGDALERADREVYLAKARRPFLQRSA